MKPSILNSLNAGQRTPVLKRMPFFMPFFGAAGSRSMWPSHAMHLTIMAMLAWNVCLFGNDKAKPVPPTEVKFVGVDETTGGNWHGKYGKEGFWLAGRASELPAYAGIDLKHLHQWIWTKETEEARALALDDGKRIAACWYDGPDREIIAPMVFTLEMGDSPRNVTFYFLDWDGKGKRQQTISIRTMDGRLLDQQSVAYFEEGQYLTWKIQGTVQVEIQRDARKNAVFSGLFVD
jgi:hypothetical protein